MASCNMCRNGKTALGRPCPNGCAAVLTPEQRIDEALQIAWQFGSAINPEHRAWVIDQMVRKLTGDGYEAFIRSITGENEEFVWLTGAAPYKT